jgi:hypothetical protein
MGARGAVRYSRRLLLAVVVLAETGCTSEPERAELTLQFDHRVQGAAMRLGESYETPFEQIVAFEHVRYWMSNVVLYQGGEPYAVPDAYYLVEQTSDGERLEVTLRVPEGSYDTLVLHIGVDPGPNASLDLMAGDLRPGIGMDWDWDTGYKFFRTEGTFAQGDAEGRFVFHTGSDELYRRLEAQLGEPLDLVIGERSELTVQAELERLFTDLDLSVQSNVLGGPPGSPAERITDNYAEMFSIVTGGQSVRMEASRPTTLERIEEATRRP